MVITPKTNRRRIIYILVALGLAVVVFVLVWFQPQKLFIEESVDESVPTVEPKARDRPRGGPPARIQELAQGPFRSLEHETSGIARVLELDGSRYLRLEDLNTSNGPDLRVYLSEIPASDDWYAYAERFLDLGPLKGNQGNQNYQIPVGTDLTRYKSAVIWCRRFRVGFGVAPLS